MTDKVRRRISYVINFVLLGPLRFGNLTDAETSDGSTSSTVSFACGFAILLITIIYLSSPVADDFLNTDSIWELLVSLMVTGTLATVVLLIGIVFGRSYDVVRRQLKDKCVELEIKFLWFSGIGVLFRTGINLAIEFECVNISSGFREISKIISSFLKIMFMLVQMIFITYLRNKRLIGGLFINFLIGGLFLVNTCIWVNFITVKIFYIYAFQNASSSVLAKNLSTWDNCYWHSETHKISQRLSSFLLTVSTLFFLLSTMFLVRLWPSIQSTTQMRNRCVVNEDVSINSDGRSNTADQLIKYRRKVRIVSFLVGFLMNSPFFTMAILMRWVYFDDIVPVKVVWDVFVILCLPILILIILAGIQNLNLSCLKKIPFSTWDVILMLCMAGNVVLNILGITSIFVCHVDRSVTIFIKNVLGLVLTYYHTVYIIVAQRTPLSVFRESTLNLSIHVILFCSFLGRWTLQTFLLTSQGMYILKEGEKCLFPDEESWRTMQYFLIPLNAFYDFQSFVFYYGKIWF